MREFIAEYCKKNEKKINYDLFNRTFDKPLANYIVDTCKNLEVIPGITLTGYEYVTDQTQIHSSVDKRNSRDPKIRNNKSLERLASPNSSIYDMLVLHFHVDVKGKQADVTKRIWVPKQIGQYYVRNGKEVMSLIQVVDNSTFVKQDSKKKGNELNFKTTLYPIKLAAVPIKIKFVDGEAFTVPTFRLDLFTKKSNPLMYILAKYGIEQTIEFFDLEKVVCVTNKILDDDTYRYIQINQNLYIEVHEKALFMHDFVSKFIGSLYECLGFGKLKITLQEVYSKEYWLERLSELFIKKRSVDKGLRVLISFEKIMDPYTRRRLCLKGYQKKNTFTIMRWMMTNYEELMRKDSNDLRTKRMRVNETQAFFIESYITKNVYSLLNNDNPSFERYMKLFNAFSEDMIFRSSRSVGGAGGSQSSMFRYERYNDFDAIALSRYTLKGPTGLNGGKKATALKYRDIYPSHLGRYDVNVCSSSDQGLTGFLCANAKFDDNGYFDADKTEPNSYDPVIEKRVDKICEKDYVKRRQDYIQQELSRGDDGFIKLQRKRSNAEMNAEFRKYPWQYGLYWRAGELHLMPKEDEPRNANGFIQLRQVGQTRGRNPRRAEQPRDENGFIILQRTLSKAERLKIKLKKQKERKANSED